VVFATWGNHEAIALKAIKDRHPAYQDYWDYVGGRWGRGLSTAEREEVVQMLMRLPVAICVGSGERRFNVLHAEFTGRDEDLYSGSPLHRRALGIYRLGQQPGVSAA